MEELRKIVQIIPWNNLIWSGISIAIAYGLWILVKKFRVSLSGRYESAIGDNVRKRAALASLFNGIKLLIIGLCTLSVLQINGIDVSSILAGLGIAGAIVGLAWQDILKDFIQGVRIMSDSFFSTGDYIRYNGSEYQVIEFSMRTTRLRSLVNGDTVTLCNRNISEVTQISGTQNIVIGLSYDTDMEKADEVLREAAEEISGLEDITECRYLGFKEFQDSSTDYLITVSAAPGLFYSSRRAALRIIRKKLNEAGLEIPFNQLDIHQK